MTLFADTSAIVKLYADEAGTEDVRQWATPWLTSTLTIAEFAAALWAKVRAGLLADDEAAALTAKFSTHWHSGASRRFVLVSAALPTVVAAAELTRRHSLRGYDAVQLGSALAARGADPECDTFAAFDIRLRAAAVAEGFRLVPPP